MNRRILLGIKRLMLPIPRPIWQSQVAKGEKGADASLDFMTAEHHRVRNFVVMEIPKVEEPLTAEYIAAELQIPMIAWVQFLMNSRGI